MTSGIPTSHLMNAGRRKPRMPQPEGAPDAAHGGGTTQRAHLRVLQFAPSAYFPTRGSHIRCRSAWARHTAHATCRNRLCDHMNSAHFEDDLRPQGYMPIRSGAPGEPLKFSSLHGGDFQSRFGPTCSCHAAQYITPGTLLKAFSDTRD